MGEKWLPGLLGSALGGVQGQKWLSPGSPMRLRRSSKVAKIDSTSMYFYQCPEVGSKTSPPGRPGDPFGAIFSVFECMLVFPHVFIAI